MTRSEQGSVVYVHRTRGEGVEGVHIRGICDGLRVRGHAISMVSPAVVATHAQAAPGKKTLKSRLMDFVGHHAPELLFELAELVYNVEAGRGVRAALASGPVRFVYERYAIFAFAAARLAHRAGVPYVVEVNYTARSPLLRQRSRLLKPLAIACDRMIFRRATLLLAVSSVLRDHLIQEYGIEPARILVIPNAADPDKFDPATRAISEVGGVSLQGRRVIGFVGTFAPWHGLDLLLDAFTRVAGRIVQATLLLIGDGPERTRIAQLAAERGLADRVVFAGSVSHADLAGYVARFDVAVLPDTNDYGSPMKIFEYLAMARPVVAPDYGPVLDVLQHDDNALVFRRRDEQSLAAALVELCSDAGRAQRIGAAGRATIVKQRTWQHNVDRILAALPGEQRA